MAGHSLLISVALHHLFPDLKSRRLSSRRPIDGSRIEQIYRGPLFLMTNLTVVDYVLETFWPNGSINFGNGAAPLNMWVVLPKDAL